MGTIDRAAPAVRRRLMSSIPLAATAVLVLSVPFAAPSLAAATPPGVPVPSGYDGAAIAFGADDTGQTEVPALPPGLTYTAVVAGGWHTVLLRSDGEAVAFGSDTSGESEVPALPPGVTYTAAAAGDAHTVLLRSDGEAVAFGNDGYGQTGVPALPPGLTYTAVAAGDYFTILLRSDGEAVAFGDDRYGQTDVPALPPGLAYTAAAGGTSHTVLLRSDGEVIAFGDDGYGETDVPALPAGMTYTAVSAAGWDTVLLRSDGNAIGFSDYDYGQVDIPALPPGTTYTAVAAGYLHTVLLRSDGRAIAFGTDLGDGLTTVPALPSGTWYTAVAAGKYHTVLLRADIDIDALRPIATTTSLTGPATAVAGSTIALTAAVRPSVDVGLALTGSVRFTFEDSTSVDVPIAADGTASTARTLDGSGTFTATAAYLGAPDGDYGPSVSNAVATGVPVDGSAVAFGSSGNGRTSVPALPIGMTYTAVAAGVDHTVLLRSDGNAVAFGRNSSGSTTVPALPSGTQYTAAAAGMGYTVLLRSDGTAVGFGSNGDGQRTIPVLPAGLTYTAVAAGDYHTVLLRSDGQVIAVGDDTYEQGDVPALPEGVVYTGVAAGALHTVLLRSDGEAVAFGLYDTFGIDDVPALPIGLRYTAAAAGEYHTVLLRSDGEVVAFGDDGDGQIDVPALPSGLSYVAVAARGYHTVLLRSDGRVIAFGDNASHEGNVPALPTGMAYTGIAAGSDHTVLLRSAIGTTTSLSGPTTAAKGTAVTLSATVAPSVAPGVGFTGTVRFTYEDSSTVDVPIAADGTASTTRTLVASGTHTATAVYLGSTNGVYRASSAASSLLTTGVPYTIAFTVDGAPYDELSVDLGDVLTAAELPPDPVRPGYDFAGWWDGAAELEPPYVVTGDAVFEARLDAWTPQLSVSSTTPAAGDTITVTGTRFPPSIPLGIELHSDPVLLATVTPDASGAFSVVVTIPADVPAGPHQIVVLGTVAAVPITVGELAATGADPRVPLLVAAGLTVLGAALVVRRRASR